MGARSEVEHSIRTDWAHIEVANWVIGKLPLLEYEGTSPECPIYQLTLDNGLVHINSNKRGGGNFKSKDKLVMSGGFEGTQGHIKVGNEMFEVRPLTSDSSTPVVLMLEPDSYIKQQKHRDPLVNINQRTQLWSTSGLVDAIIVLPDRPNDMPPQYFYDEAIHNLIAPAKWCVNVENPHFFEILNRGKRIYEYDFVRLFVHHIEVHTSFLASTKSLTSEEVKDRLYKYLFDLVMGNRYSTTKILSPEEEVDLYLDRIAKGL